jgi:rhodanese-related sulfurtransferase
MLTPINAADLDARLRAGTISLIDIREPDERARERIAGTISLPLSRLETGHIDVIPRGAVAFHCRSGMRTASQCGRLATHVQGEGFVLEGGLESWKAAGLAVEATAGAPMELQRQVHLTIGTLVVVFSLLAAFVDLRFLVVPAIMGLGLMNAGLTGWCGLAKLMALAPWNRAGQTTVPVAKATAAP